MGTSVASLLELIEEGSAADDAQFAHLLGQLVAEVVVTPPRADDVKEITSGLQFSSTMTDGSVDTPGLHLAYTVLLGMFQALYVELSSQPERAGQASVKERILFALAESSAGPTEIAERVGCATEVASRTLRMLREEKLVQRAETTGPSDRRYHIQELAPEGEAFVDRRLSGDFAPLPDESLPADDAISAPESATAELRGVVDLARHLNARDPRRAASLGPTLERLKSQVDDRLLRAEAIGELCVTARSVKGTYDRNDLERWYNELLDMADVDPRIAARGYYERSRWKTMYESPGGLFDKALKDLARAREVAERLQGDDKHHRLGWCAYQEAAAALYEDDFPLALQRAEEAQRNFDEVTSADLEPEHGTYASELIRVRALHGSGKAAEAVRDLRALALSADQAGYLRQSADAQMWLGRWEASAGEAADERVAAALRTYEELGNTELAVEAKAVKSALQFFDSDGSTPHAVVLQSQLAELLTKLQSDAGRLYPRAHYWRTATLWRKLGVVAAQAGAYDESDNAFRTSLQTYVETGNVVGQEDTLVCWWITRHQGESVSPTAVEEWAVEVGAKLLSSKVISTVADRLEHSPSDVVVDSDSRAHVLRSTLLG